MIKFNENITYKAVNSHQRQWDDNFPLCASVCESMYRVPIAINIPGCNRMRIHLNCYNAEFDIFNLFLIYLNCIFYFVIKIVAIMTTIPLKVDYAFIYL